MTIRMISALMLTGALGACGGPGDPLSLVPPADRALMLGVASSAQSQAHQAAFTITGQDGRGESRLFLAAWDQGSTVPEDTIRRALRNAGGPEEVAAVEIAVAPVRSLDGQGAAALAERIRRAAALGQSLGLSQDQVRVRVDPFARPDVVSIHAVQEPGAL